MSGIPARVSGEAHIGLSLRIAVSNTHGRIRSQQRAWSHIIGLFERDSRLRLVLKKSGKDASLLSLIAEFLETDKP